MPASNHDGFIFRFDNSYMEKAEKFDYVNIWQISENNIEPDREIAEHIQFCHEITYVISGKGTFYSGEDKVLLQPGDIHVIAKGVKHKIVPEERCNFRFANIGFEFSEELCESMQPVRAVFEKDPYFVLRDNGEIRVLMTMLINELQSQQEYSHTRIECFVKLVLTQIYRMTVTEASVGFSPKKSTATAKLTPYSIIRYVDNNLFECSGIGDIARALGYSQSYISHMFKEKMGITLQEYICSKKIEASLDFLKYQKFTVTQIAMMLNYASVQSFCKAFRKAVGYSPTEYQRRNCGAGNKEGNPGGEAIP